MPHGSESGRDLSMMVSLRWRDLIDLPCSPARFQGATVRRSRAEWCLDEIAPRSNRARHAILILDQQ
jgi:hypothetical protein